MDNKSQFVLLPSIHGVYNLLAASPLYSRIEPPDTFQFEVGPPLLSLEPEPDRIARSYKVDSSL